MLPSDPANATNPTKRNGSAALLHFTTALVDAKVEFNACDQAFVHPVDYSTSRLPEVQPSIAEALSRQLPPLEIPKSAIRQAAWQNSDQFEALAKRLMEQLTSTEPIRRAMRNALARVTAGVARHHREVVSRLELLEVDRKVTQQWTRRYLIDADFEGASDRAKQVFLLQVIAICASLLFLSVCSFVAIRVLVMDMYGLEGFAEILSYVVPTVAITFFMGKLPFISNKAISDANIQRIMIVLIAIGVPTMLGNISLMGLQDTELSMPIDIDLSVDSSERENMDAPDGKNIPADPWYTEPFVRVAIIAMADLVCVACLSLILKLKLQQAVRPTIELTAAFIRVDAAVELAANLLAEIETLRNSLKQVTETLQQDCDGQVQCIVSALHAERWQLDVEMSKAVTHRMNQA